MRCDIETFEVKCIKHPTDATPTAPVWRILIQVRFRSDAPENWGELRAYGASWTRALNRFFEPEDFLSSKPPRPDPALRFNPRVEERHSQLTTHGTCPPWGHAEGPKKVGDREWRLDNDQHIEIFYAKQVSGVPRSMPKSRHLLADDRNPPDRIKHAERPEEIDLSSWHIVGRDEPMSSGFQPGDFVEYWHQAEFQVRVPKTTKIVARKRLFCRVNGLFPDLAYRAYVE